MPDQHDNNCEQAAAVLKKNSTSTICFGTDSPAMPARPSGRAVADFDFGGSAASPATTARIRDGMRTKMLEGNDDVFKWQNGSPADVTRNHAPLRPNPEIHVKGCDENRRANTASHFTIGGEEAEVQKPRTTEAADPTEDQHDNNCEQAAAVLKKNSTSTICFGTDSPAVSKRAEHFLTKPVGPQPEPVASPATTARIRDGMRTKMLEGNDDAFKWQNGSPADVTRNHAPLRPNPEIHVKGCDENRRANTASHFTIGGEEAEAQQVGAKIPSSTMKRAHGTTKEEAARLASRVAVASPHTMKQREMGEHTESFNGAAFNTASPVVTARGVGAALKSSVVLGISESPMQTHQSRAKASCVPVNDATEQSREVLSTVYQNNKANFEKVTLEFC
jgi:hypothetical protein